MPEALQITDPTIIKKLNQGRQSAMQNGLPVSQPPSNITQVTDPQLLQQLELQRQANVARTNAMSATSSVVPEQLIEPSTPLEKIGGTLETAASLVSAVIAEPLSGIAGIVVGLTDQDLNSAVSTIENARAALTYTPQTPEGRQQQEALAGFIQPVGEAIVRASESLGDFGYRTTKSPEVATALYTLPTLGLELLGLKAGTVARSSTSTARQLKNQQRVLLNDPNLGRYSGAVADVKLNRAGNVVPDPIGTQLIDAGMPRNHVAVITNSSPDSKAIMMRMFDKFEAGQTNNIAALSARMSDEIGASLTTRMAALQTRRTSLGNRLDALVSGPLRDATLRIDAPVVDFFQDLAKDFDLKPVISANGTLGLRGMDTGVLSTSSMSGVRRMIDDVVDVLNQSQDGGQISLRAAHRLKKGLDEMVDAARASEAGLSGTTHSRLLGLRAGINTAIGESFDTYRTINGDLSQVIETMKPFDKYRGVGQTWGDTRVSSVIGGALDNLDGSSSTARGLVQDVHALEQSLSEMGLRFGDDTSALIDFKRGVEDFFSLDEDMLNNSALATSPIARKALDAAASGAVGNTYGLTHDISSLVSLGMKKAAAAQYLKDLQVARTGIRKALREDYVFPSLTRSSASERVGVITGGAAGSASVNSGEEE